MPLTLLAMAASSLIGETKAKLRETEAIQDTLMKNMEVESPTYFSDGERDLMTGERCILERAGNGWVTYDPKTGCPMSAYGRYDYKYWDNWFNIVKNK